jgi:hypothetical protein
MGAEMAILVSYGVIEIGVWPVSLIADEDNTRSAKK